HQYRIGMRRQAVNPPSLDRKLPHPAREAIDAPAQQLFVVIPVTLPSGLHLCSQLSREVFVYRIQALTPLPAALRILYGGLKVRTAIPGIVDVLRIREIHPLVCQDVSQ